MADYQTTLKQLHTNLNTLRERESKYAGNAPLDLLNQIADHEQAIVITEQAIDGEFTEAEWQESLKPLLLAFYNGQVVNVKAETFIAGDQIITHIFEAPPPPEAKERRDLGILLKNVETTWIKGVLEKSVHEAALLDLGIETRDDAVDNPWQMVLEAPDQSRQVLPKGTKIKAVFEEANRFLLILGDPGSGKTTTLLQLTRALMIELKQDPAFTKPVPVIFNLSTWTDKQQSLADWLVAELSSKYRTPKKQGRLWLKERRILPLLDGLDEAKPENRVACVEQINRLAVDYGLQGMVVCSRVKEYTDLNRNLQFNSAIYLQPLTSEQVAEYFERVGDKLTSLRAALQQDEVLQSLAQSPLMLNIMSLAYQDSPTETLSTSVLATGEARRRHLFDTYIARIFKRKGHRWSYDAEQTKRRLSWLARNMQLFNQEVFLIEGLQPSWLQTRRWRWTYAFASRLIGVLSIGLAFGLTFLLFAGPYLEGRLGGARGYGLVLGLVLGMSFGLIAGLSGGLFIGLIDILRFELFGKATEIIPKFWRSIINVLIIWLLIGPTCGVCTLAIIPTHGPFFALVLGLIFGPRGSRQSVTYDIQTVEALRWSWGKALKGGVIGGLVGGLTVILIGGFLLFNILNLFVVFDADFPWAGSSAVLLRVLYFLFLSGIIGGLIGGLIGTIFGGLSRDIIEAKTVPNQGIRLSARNAIFGGLAVGVIGGLIIEVSYRLFGWEWMSSLLLPGLILGLAFGLLGALWYGGLDLIQHYTLRLILIIQGHTPRNYARFLDYANDLIFLQQVGGGYRFIHRLLLEHFAAMYEATPPRES